MDATKPAPAAQDTPDTRNGRDFSYDGVEANFNDGLPFDAKEETRDADGKWVVVGAAQTTAKPAPGGNDEVKELLQTADTKTLVAASKREINLNEAARETLTERGMDADGKWIGFEAARAAAQADKKKTDEVETPKAAQPTASEKAATNNTVESDEVFTATKRDEKPVIPPEIEKRYLRVGDKYYHPQKPEEAAFVDKGNKLETKSSNEQVAESMVRIAEARGWDEIKVSGSETFRREAWLEAAARGMHVKGYSPSEQDKAALALRVSTGQAAKLDSENKTFRARENETRTPAKDQHAAGAAAQSVLDKKTRADGLSPAARAVVAARVQANITNSIERGAMPEMNIRETLHEAQTDREATL